MRVAQGEGAKLIRDKRFVKQQQRKSRCHFTRLPACVPKRKPEHDDFLANTKTCNGRRTCEATPTDLSWEPLSCMRACSEPPLQKARRSARQNVTSPTWKKQLR